MSDGGVAPYGIGLILIRVGNLVIVSNTSTTTHSVPNTSGTGISLPDKIPEGFRPKYSPTSILASSSWAPGSTNKVVEFIVSTNGDMAMMSEGVSCAGHNRFSCQGMWITNDPWPTS